MAEKLNREIIARAGLRLLDSGGVDRITMRALAAELGVQAPALYWHVKSKKDIFEAMALAISQDAADAAAATNPHAPWHERLKSWAYAMRSSVLSHRDGARVFAGTFAADSATFTVTEAALAAWQEAGMSVEESAQRMILLRYFIVGFCIEARGLAEVAERRSLTDSDESPDMFFAEDFPHEARSLSVLTVSDSDQLFELGLQLMLQIKPE